MILACVRCGHTWQAKVACPARCPACNSADWDRPATGKWRVGIQVTGQHGNAKGMVKV